MNRRSSSESGSDSSSSDEGDTFEVVLAREALSHRGPLSATTTTTAAGAGAGAGAEAVVAEEEEQEQLLSFPALLHTKWGYTGT